MNKKYENLRPTYLALIVGVFAVSTCVESRAQSRDPFKSDRLKMVRDFIEAEGVSNPRVLEAMRNTPRHDFVPLSWRKQAYQDGALPIGDKQTISPPYIVAYMTETLDPQEDDKVLEIGTGSGYQAAVLSPLVKEVYTIEIVNRLGVTAARRLKKLRYDNVHAKVGDGYKGWPEHAPFDKIIVTCSPEKVPKPLVDQLKEGGRMIIPLGRRYQQVFYLFEKKDGKLVEEKLIPTLFVPMTGISEDRRQVKPDPRNPKIVNGGFESDEIKPGLPDNWHYRRQVELVDEDAPEGKRYAEFKNTERGQLSQCLQGMAVDGRAVTRLRLSAMVQYEDGGPGLKSWHQPGVFVHFYDANRRPIDDETGVLGPFLGTAEKWRRYSTDVKVPGNAREAVIRTGLNGGTGTLRVDDVSITPR